MIQRPPLPPDSPMPWGQHRGTPVKDVPLTYLLWLRSQTWIKDYPAMWAYLATRKAELDAVQAAESPVANAAATFSSYEDYLTMRGR